MDRNYQPSKSMHEQFVTNLPGTSVVEIAALTCIAPVLVLLRNLLCLTCSHTEGITNLTKFSLDYIVLVVGQLLACTVFCNYIWLQLVSLLVICMTAHCIKDTYSRTTGKTFSTVEDLKNTVMHNHRPFITYFRSYVNIGTAIAILAIDFHVYPRRFGKVETFGTGVMDAGVGVFIVANAVVSPEARGKNVYGRSRDGHLKQAVSTVIACVPLVFLGIVRVLSVKSVDYQEHVSEYGVHWNFFFTLAIVKLFSSVVLCICNVHWLAALGLAIAITYQYCLSYMGLEDIILHGIHGANSRDGWLDANREGIASCVGYCALYLLAVQLGKYLFHHRSRVRQWIHALLVLCACCIFCGSLLVLCEWYITPISRRLANISFIIWMLTHSFFLLAAFLLVDIITVIVTEVQGPRTSKQMYERREVLCLLEAVNKNGLLYFLLANLFTGAVNLSIDTLAVSDEAAVVVLGLYMLLLSTVATVLKVCNVTVKFW